MYIYSIQTNNIDELQCSNCIKHTIPNFISFELVFCYLTQDGMFIVITVIIAVVLLLLLLLL